MEYVQNTLTAFCEKSKMVSFVSSIMKNIVVFPAWSRFSVKLICWNFSRSVSSACCLLKSIAIILLCFLNKDNLVEKQLFNHFLDYL